MKILCVAPISAKTPSGVSSYVAALLKGASHAHGVRIGLLAHDADSDDLGEMNQFLVMKPLRQYHWNPYGASRKYLDAVFGLFGRPDVVHFHDVYQPLQAALSLQLKHDGIPYICSPHGGMQRHSQKRKFWKKVFGNISFSDKFILDSLAVHVLNDAEAVAVREKFMGKKVFIVPNGVPDDVASLQRRSRVPKHDDAGICFGFIGRIDLDHKGIDLLLKAIRRMQTAHPHNRCRFIFAGPFFGAKNQQRFWALVKALPRPDAVEYRGIVLGPEKDHMFEDLDVFVHTSRHEGMPGAVLEAMARGVPCLVTPGTNVQEMILGCRGGWGCAPDVDAIARELESISREGDEVFKKGAAAREYALGHLTWSKIANQYVETMKELIQNTR